MNERTSLLAARDLRQKADALLQYVSDGTDGLMVPGFIHLADAAEVMAVVSVVPALVEAYEALYAWASRMPDAGFSDQDPRWEWWHERPR